MGWYGCCCGGQNCEECLPAGTTIYITLPSCSDASGDPACTGCSWLNSTFSIPLGTSSVGMKHYYNSSPSSTELICSSQSGQGAPSPCTGYPCFEMITFQPARPFFSYRWGHIRMGRTAYFECVEGGLFIEIQIYMLYLRYLTNGNDCQWFSQYKWSQTFPDFDCPFVSKEVGNYTETYGTIGGWASDCGTNYPSPGIGCQFSGNATVYV